MKKIISILSIFLVFILSLTLVNANYYWWQEANAGYRGVSLGGYNFIGFGSNYQSGISITNSSNSTYQYTKCDIIKSDFSPVAFDFDGDGMLEVVITDVDLKKIYIYDADCNLEGSISIPDEIIQDMPVLFDNDINEGCIDSSNPSVPIFTYCSDFNPKIMVLTDRSLKEIGYSIGTYGITNSIDYLSETSNETLNYLVCRNIWLGERCFGYRVTGDNNDAGSLEKTVFFDDDSANLYPAEYDTVETIPYPYGSLTDFPSPLVPLDLIPFGLTSYESSYDSALLNVYGDVEYKYDIGDAGGHLFQNHYDSVHYIAKIGVGYYIVSYNSYSDYGGVGPYDFVEEINIIELFTGTNVLELSSSVSLSSGNKDISNRSYSNPVVVDFDKDGSNEFAILFKSGDTIQLLVYEQGFESSSTVNYSSVMTNINNMVIGNFYDSLNLCLATVEGIFCDGYKYFDTGEDSDWSYPIIVFKDLTSDKTLFYLSSEEGFIVSVNLTSTICGDGICQPTENDFNCPSDCLNETIEEPDEDVGEYREGSPCRSDADCVDNLKCEYGICTKLMGGAECTKDSDCISGECLNGYCTKPSLWQGLDASKDQIMGDDAETNNFLSIIIMLLVAGSIGYYLHIWGGIASLFISAIFFTMVGWLSGFILVGLLIAGVIALVFSLIIGSKT